MVSSNKDNPDELAGLPVREIKDVGPEVDKRQIYVVIATPEDVQPAIVTTLKQYGYEHYICIDSRKEAALMEHYYRKMGIFPSLHQQAKGERAVLQIYQAKSYKDIQLANQKEYEWLLPIQAGTALTQERVAEVCDDTGDHISYKNANYCELTALYWIWKNILSRISVNGEMAADYYGLCQYRRILDIRQDDLCRLRRNSVDVILPYPTIHEPDIREHHGRYVAESDWQAMLQALREITPEYYEAYGDIFLQQYLYNYNILVAKPDVLKNYCEWLFPILERTEELSVPKGSARADRYLGYLGENLLTLYFMHNKDKLYIVHTGRIMLV